MKDIPSMINGFILYITRLIFGMIGMLETDMARLF